MANITEVERKPAPSVSVDITMLDQRRAIEDAHQTANPDYSYAYQRPNITNGELEQLGWQKVTDGKGECVHHGGDPLVRKPKAKRDQERKREDDISYNMVKHKLDRADREGKLTQVASKKSAIGKK